MSFKGISSKEMAKKAFDQAARLLKSAKPDRFELYFESKSSVSIEARDQKIDSLSRAEDLGLAIRLIKNQRMGFSFTTSLGSQAIEKTVNSAIQVAEVMPEDPFVDLHHFKDGRTPQASTFDLKGIQVPLEEKMDRARELETLCRQQDPRIRGVRTASLRQMEFEVWMQDDQGRELGHQDSIFTSSVLCVAQQDSEQQMGGDFEFSHRLDKLEISEVARRAAGYALEKLGARPAPTMKCPAVFRNEVLADLLEFLSPSFSAEEIDKGRSMLAGRENQKVFSDSVTLINDGLLENGLSTYPFDGEGFPTQKTVLIQDGAFTSALYNQYYARKAAKTPTGSSVRSIKSPPVIGTANFYLEPGTHSFEQLLEGIDRGVVITSLMGLHTANAVTGDFMLRAEGFMIENGKLSHPVRGFAVAGNILEVFRRMTDIGNDRRFFGSVGAPSARISELSVGGN